MSYNLRRNKEGKMTPKFYYQKEWNHKLNKYVSAKSIYTGFEIIDKAHIDFCCLFNNETADELKYRIQNVTSLHNANVTIRFNINKKRRAFRNECNRLINMIININL